MKKLLIVLTALVLVFAAVACGGDDTSEPATDTDEAAEPAEDDAAGGATVTASNFAFDPTELEVASGDTITFVNEDDAEHSFTIDKTDIEEELEEPGEVDVTIDLDAGDYDFYCKYHRDTMTGTLTVT